MRAKVTECWFHPLTGLEDENVSWLGGELNLLFHSQPNYIVPKLYDFSRRPEKKVQPDLSTSSVAIIQSNIPTGSARVRAQGHCRDFSFSPGDDCANFTLADASRHREKVNGPIFSRSVAWHSPRQNARDQLGESAKANLSGGLASSLRPQQHSKSIIISVAGSGVSNDIRRDASAQSILTTIIGRSKPPDGPPYLIGVPASLYTVKLQ